MGEAKRRQIAVQTQALEAMVVATLGVYDAWVNNCPLGYTSPNAHSKRDVLGTWLLAILAGHNRYAHITGLRGDAVSPQILGMDKIISEDALRRSLSRMSAEQSQTWLAPQLLGSVQAALNTPWILDIDTTIKPLYGKQSGAEVSYNPHKPGRPSHALHTLLGGQSAPRTRCGGLPRQRTQRCQSTPRLDRRSGQTRTPAAPGPGPRRLRLWQRALHRRVGGARPALPVQATPDRWGQEIAGTPIRA